MMPQTPEMIVDAAYRWILGRAPDPAGFAHHLHLLREGRLDASGLRRAFLSSPEFAAGADAILMDALSRILFEPPQSIEHEVDDATLSRLADRVRRQWTRLGEEDPHWSVLTDDAFRVGRINDEARARFDDSGVRDAALLDAFEARTGVSVQSGICLELGCGTGRVTRSLAERFDRVIAVDVSPGNLAECEARLARDGIDNVEARLISTPGDLVDLPPADLLFSTMVLQHNPPPVQVLMLRTLLPQCAAALFQTPASMPGYGFRAADHVAAPEAVMDMHCLPRHVVLAEIARAGLTLVDLCPDHFTGVPGSFTYFAVRS